MTEPPISEDMNPRLPPRWAQVFGEDRYGLFAECMVTDVRFVWRWICPGTFIMGSPHEEQGRWHAEGPQHVVTLTRGFWLGETPVTQAQWRSVMGANPSYFKGTGELPVEQVNWPECNAFGTKLNALLPDLHAALPTEAQWEYACRAGTQKAFNNDSPCTLPFGKDLALDMVGWFDDNSEGRTHQVRQKAPNAWGLYDMLGNVWEWCADAWDSDIYGGRSPTVTDPYLDSSDHSCPRSMRGGSWVNLARDCRSAYRGWDTPNARWFSQGLRLAAGQNEPRAAEPL